MKRKKIFLMNELFNSVEFKNKLLRDMDLSSLDLSKLPASTWEGFTFYNINFSNTNIKFYPSKLLRRWTSQLMIDCDFTNCDLSYFEDGELDKVCFNGCNFTNTDLNIAIKCWSKTPIRGVIFGDALSDERFEALSEYFDVDILRLNPNRKLSSCSLLKMLHEPLDLTTNPQSLKEALELNHYTNQEALIEKIKFIEEVDKNNENRLEKLYEYLKSICEDPFLEDEKYLLYLGFVYHKTFTCLDMENIDEELLKCICFVDCEFKSAHFLTYNNKENNFWHSHFNHITFDNINYSSWTNVQPTRFCNSHITMRVNAYVELDRICNGKCAFCRNNFLPPCKYDYENIFGTLYDYSKYIDSIVIGGGEPSLRKNNSISLIEFFRFINTVKVFSNASDGDYLEELAGLCDGFNISRHAISDNDNNKIFGLDTLTNNQLTKLCKKIPDDVTLCCTCFKGLGVDTLEKMQDYITFASECHANSILFQTLHQDLNGVNPCLPVEHELFDKMINILRLNGWKIDFPIYSTGDYKLVIAKNPNKDLPLRAISFKKYITLEELEKEWYRSPKRTFDLSISPDGTLYQNWHQSYGKVLKK